jgi:hypothetical protein
MLKITLIFICSIIVLLSHGCSGNTIVSKTHYYPSDKNFETAEYRLAIDVHGKDGKSYTAETEKKIIVTIWRKDKELLKREYKCLAASLEWAVTWNELDDLNILFFDFPEGASIYDKNASEFPAKNILSLRFTFDAEKKKFVEYPVSQDVVKKIKR